jgi:Ca2+-binding EF-hand superfamily protein
MKLQQFVSPDSYINNIWKIPPQKYEKEKVKDNYYQKKRSEKKLDKLHMLKQNKNQIRQNTRKLYYNKKNEDKLKDVISVPKENDSIKKSSKSYRSISCPKNNALSPNSCLKFNKKLFNFLLDLLKQDLILDEIKQSLAEIPEVNLTDLFNTFDYSQTNNVNVEDINQVLIDFGTKLSNDDFKFLFSRYYKSLDNKFDYEEICDIFLPKNFSMAKIMSERSSSIEFNGFSYETKKIICFLFEKIIEAEKSNEYFRNQIFKDTNNTPFDLFNLIKKPYFSGIYKEDLIQFMKLGGRIIKQTEGEILMNRMDLNQDGLIDYAEFLKIIMPKIN